MQNPSPVKTNAQTLISELEKPANCSPDETLCLAEVLQRKLEAAVAGLKSIVRIDEQREGIIADMQSRIDIRGAIIDDLKKVDKNSQTIDTRGQEINAIWKDQHRDDKETIASLQKDLESCRSNQKWVFGAGAITGGLVGYKIGGAGSFRNPFVTNATNASPFFGVTRDQRSFFNFPQTQAEENLKRALQILKH